VLERDFDSGEGKEDVQKEDDDVVPVLEQPEVPSMEGDKSLGDVEEVSEQKQQYAVDVEPVQEEENPGEVEVPVAVEETSKPKEEELIERDPVVESAIEEVEQPALSKKQKKKDKKKKQKQEEKVEEEETTAPGPKQLPAEEKDQAEALIEPSQETHEQPIAELEPAAEQQPAQSAEEISTEQTRDLDLDVSQPQLSEDVESVKDIEPTQVENVVPEPEQLDEAPPLRKLSKKEKKKQRQALGQQAETEAVFEPLEQEAQATAEPETSAFAPIEQQEDIQPAVTSDAPVQSSIPLEDDSKEVELPVIEAEQPIATGHERTEPVDEPLFEGPKPEGGDLAPAPAHTTVIVPPPEPAESLEQVPSEDAPEAAEQPTITRKMSKKDKKKAAAAAALATEEEKPAEPEPALSNASPAAEENIDLSKDEPAVDDTQQSPESETELQRQAAEQDRDNTDLVVSDTTEDAAEKQVAEGEQQVEPSAEEPKLEQVIEEPVVDEPITRKISKKEKRKAKKQAEQQVFDSPTMEADTAQEAVAEPEPEDVAVKESIPTEQPREVVPEAEPVAQEETTAQEISQPEELPIPSDDYPDEEIKEIEHSEPSVPLGSSDAPSYAEAKNDQPTLELGDERAFEAIGK
jgi:hypothetical protein